MLKVTGYKMQDCIFCKIVNKEIPTEVIIYEDEEILVFKDINPKAPVHFLIIPKKHIPSLKVLEPGDKVLMGNLVLVAKKIAEEKGIQGYKFVCNVGKEGGQVVEHLHLHFLAGKPVNIP